MGERFLGLHRVGGVGLWAHRRAQRVRESPKTGLKVQISAKCILQGRGVMGENIILQLRGLQTINKEFNLKAII